MAVPVMMRFDDDVATMLRERAQLERRSVNRLVNEVMRAYLESLKRNEPERPMTESSNRSAVLRKRFGDHLEAVRRAIKPLAHQETQDDMNEKVRLALEALRDCLEVTGLVLEADGEPVNETTFA